MIDLPLHRKITSGDANEEEIFDDFLEEVNELYMARRDWRRKGVKKAIDTDSAEGRHVKKECADVLLTCYGLICLYAGDRDQAEEFIIRVILDNIRRGKYDSDTQDDIVAHILHNSLSIAQIKNTLEALR